MSALTLEQRKAIAAKAVATRRANLAAAGSPTPTLKASTTPKQPTKHAAIDAEIEAQELARRQAAERNYSQLAPLPSETPVRYYDEGWRIAKLLQAAVEQCQLLSVPAYGVRPTRFSFPTSEVQAVPATA